MTGSGVVLTEVCVLGISTLFVIIGIAVLRGKNQENLRFGIGFTILGGLLFVGVGSITAIAYTNRNSFRNLSAESIAQIQVGQEIIVDRDEVKQIAGTFQDIQPFLPNHEVDPTIPFVVKLKSGEVYKFRIKYRSVKSMEGVVIQFVPANVSGYWNKGYAFSVELRSVFEQLGIILTE
nr:putative integron gene cassette protein [uncultured bacterium]